MQRDIGVSRVADITGLDVVGIPVCAVIRPQARSLSVAQGKGMTRTASRISGLMEAAELHHAEFLTPAGGSFSLADAGSMPVVDLDLLPRYLDRQLDPTDEIPWIAMTDLTTGHPVMVPRCVVTMDRRPDRDAGSNVFIGGATGLGAGFSFADALHHALCEIVERDAFTLWKAGAAAGATPRHVDLSTIADPDCTVLLEQFHDAGLRVIIWAMPSDLGLPAYVVEAFDPNEPPRTLCSYSHGTGCAIDPAVAARKALLEAAQTRLTYISGARDDLTPADYETDRASLIAHRLAYLAAAHRGMAFPVRMPGAGPSAADGNDYIRRLAAAQGYDVLALDLAPADTPIHVVKAIIPGFEDDIGVTRYGPGARLLRQRLSCQFEQL
jgi:ribosomal protein S12 methylthiotransferase accessory factor